MCHEETSHCCSSDHNSYGHDGLWGYRAMLKLFLVLIILGVVFCSAFKLGLLFGNLGYSDKQWGSQMYYKAGRGITQWNMMNVSTSQNR